MPIFVSANSNGVLNDLIRSGRDSLIELEVGDYEIDYADYVSLNLVAASPLSTRIHLHRPLSLSYHSRVRDVMLLPVGDFAAVNLDRSSYAKFEGVVIRSHLHADRLEIARRKGKTEVWDDFERRGIGVETTGANIGDDAYGVVFRDCRFESLRAGVKTAFPKAKGTVAWVLNNCVFDGCEMGLDLTRAGEFRVRDGIVQLARCGISFRDSRSNWFEFIHFERSALDIYLDEQSCLNQFFRNDAPPRLIQDRGMDNRIQVMRHRNIDRPCVPGLATATEDA